MAKLKIIRIKDETPDVKTFRLETSEQVSFISGQYALFSFEEEGESRPFTISSSPLQSKYIEITVKKMADFTTRLHSLKEGEFLFMGKVKGEALNFDENIKEDVVFLAGGSGITPFISALKYAKDKGINNNFTLLYGSREESDIIYKDELDLLDDSQFKIVNVLSGEAEGWKGEKGRVDKGLIEKYVSDIGSKLWYICGPPPMVNSLKDILADLGVERSMIRVEDWQLPGKNDK